MFIVPLDRMKSIAELKSIAPAQQNENPIGTQMPFKDIFAQAVEQIKATDAVQKQDSINLAMGNTDDLHNIIINMNKAQMAIDYASEIRNKVLDSYNEVMRMNV